MSINTGMMSSNSAEWATPTAFFEELNREFGFTLDPCCTVDNRKCDRFYTKEDDGLSQDWSGEIVFCNPPYGTELPKWVAKCHHESLKGTTVVMLIPARTDTRYFHEYIYMGNTKSVSSRVGYISTTVNNPHRSPQWWL